MGIVAKAFKKLPKVKNIAQSGHTAYKDVHFKFMHLKFRRTEDHSTKWLFI